MSVTSSVLESTPRQPALTASVRRFVVLIVAGTALLQLLWIAVVPPFRGTDEFDHAYRAAGVANGHWRATETPQNGRGLLVEAPGSLVKAAHNQCAALDYTGPDNCSAAVELGNGQVLVASGAGGYHPAFYWVVGTVAKPFSGAAALYVMRGTAALLCLVFVGLAAWAVGMRRQSGWSRFGLVVAMTPVMLYSTALPAPNGLEIAAALTFWCALLGLDGTLEWRHERKLLLMGTASAAVLMVDRTLGPLFALCILMTVWCLRPSLVRNVFLRHRRTFFLGSVVVLAAAGWAIAWFLTNGAGQPGPERQGGGWTWSALILWPMQAIAAFPFRNQAAPTFVYPVIFLIFLALVVGAMRMGEARQRLVLGGTLLAGLAIPLLLTLATYEGRGSMWQGRYGLPFTVGIVLVATAVLDDRRWSTRFRPGLLVVGSVLMGVSAIACYAKVLQDELGRSVSRDDPAWHAPSVLVVVVVTGLAWLLFHIAYSRRDDVAA